MSLHLRPIIRSSGLALAAMGVAPFPGFDFAETADPTFDAAFQADASEGSPQGVAHGNPRLRGILRQLEEPSDVHSNERASLVRSLVAQHCRASVDGELPGPGRMNLLHHGVVSRSVAWFQCQSGNEPIVVPLRSL
jgi:hypothetical protein